MAKQERVSVQRTCSRPLQGMNTKSIKEKCLEDTGCSLQESSRTDSGFLSGANLLSDQNISSDDLSTPVSQKSGPDLDVKRKNDSESSYMRLDSGVDVSLNDQFSCLSLCKSAGYNDLSCDVKSNTVLTDYTNPSVDIKKEESKSVVEAWESYFKQDEDGDTQLHIAIIQGFIEVVFSLIRMAPLTYFLDICNSVGQSPLHLAVLTRQPRVVRQLVVCGADPSRVDRNGNTPLHLACQYGDLECVRSLTEPITVAEKAAANVRHPGLIRQLPQDLDECNYDGEMCVHLAAKEGHIDILRHLAWFGANINARDCKGGMTVLHYAVENRDEELLNFLLEDSPSGLVLDTPTYAGYSAYQLAAAVNSAAAAALLAHGASLMDTDDEYHPDHNNEDSEDEMPEVDTLGGFSRNEVSVL